MGSGGVILLWTILLVWCKESIASSNEIRLVGGNSTRQGRVEVYHDGQWGTVCHNGFDINDAHAVCRELGYGLATEVRSHAAFGEGSGPVWLNDVACKGFELAIRHCSHTGWGKNNCQHHEDVGVVCSGCGGLFNSETGTLTSPNYPQDYSHNLECEWTIVVVFGNRASIIFDPNFYIEPHDSCVNDYVMIRELYISRKDVLGSRNLPLFLSRPLGTFCGNNAPPPIQGTGVTLSVRFRSDSSHSGMGFSANWTIELDPKPCGDFPWDADDVTVHCNYSSSGICTVRCPSEATMLTGPFFDADNRGGVYHCNIYTRTWEGIKPVCLGRKNSSVVVTDETNQIRLVGGEFYGCVEMYDNVTNQWGPVRGEDHVRKAWTDVACRNLGFTKGLATEAYLLSNGIVSNGTVMPLAYSYFPGYPSTGPRFVIDMPSPDLEYGSLRDAIRIQYVDRTCSPGQSCDYDLVDSIMCMACAGERNLDGEYIEDRKDTTGDGVFRRTTTTRAPRHVFDTTVAAYYEGSKIGANVTCTSYHLLVSFLHTLNDRRYNKEDVQLAAPPCSAEENSTHIYIQTPLTDCGTERRVTEDSIIYSNTLTVKLNASGTIQVSVECHLPRHKQLTVGINHQPVVKSLVVGTAEFTVSMDLYLSDTFMSPVSEYPLYVMVGQMLYVQIQLTSDDSNLQVFVKHCFLTFTEIYNHANTDNIVIIRNGCLQDSSTVRRYPPPSTMEERFGFQAFTSAIKSHKMFLHCFAVLCNATDPNSLCARGCDLDQHPDRRRRQPEESTDVYRYQLVRGPILLNDDETTREDVSTGEDVEDTSTSSHAERVTSSFMGACAVLIAAILIIISS
ncbi:deleted in malignant brain tumors 1 protein-like [Branchiostoma floridae]|uniref:Scavenger receptor cysteine-rich domain-containing protein DMBT1 n=2 Tax=Branchiostoma floridae TaxID=7739 RepID=A0A9J7HKF7_BRAFL|nr:deleted in malignant brain tumors 1 protein-like [Branchiostoma floridae]XP_035660020.1 deleted in malignant brain tumors 1 protein-like [Branchiostoma floridae]